MLLMVSSSLGSAESSGYYDFIYEIKILACSGCTCNTLKNLKDLLWHKSVLSIASNKLFVWLC